MINSIKVLLGETQHLDRFGGLLIVFDSLAGHPLPNSSIETMDRIAHLSFPTFFL